MRSRRSVRIGGHTLPLLRSVWSFDRKFFGCPRGGWLVPSGVPRKKAFLLYWLPVLLWMGVIFYASTDAGHPRHTSRYLGPLVRWLFPSWGDEAVESACYVVRKFAHGYEYMVLGLLLWRAFGRTVRGKTRAEALRVAAKAWVLATVYAASDEFHQLFVAGREGSVRDVAIDSAGAVFGLLVFLAFGCWRRWW